MDVGVIISVAPFFTALLSRLFLKQEGTLRANFFIGFLAAMAGIGFISFNGAAMELNPAGDLLALLAAFLWACYSILTRIISGFGYPTIPATRRIFLYGILFMVPVITIAASVLILHEPFTALTGLGTVLTLAGLFISQNDCFRKRG